MASAPAVLSSSAELSIDGRYRYTLTRTLATRLGADPERVAAFVMLNPSTADEHADDPTIRRCIGFADREGCGALVVVNLSAIRATDPAELAELAEPDETVTRNAVAIRSAVRLAARSSGPVIAAWGASSSARGWPGRAARVAALERLLRAEGVGAVCLGATAAGDPRHPLYVRGDAPLIPWPVPTCAICGDVGHLGPATGSAPADYGRACSCRGASGGR